MPELQDVLCLHCHQELDAQARAKAWRELVGLLDKLLVCYRMNQNPGGALLDRISEARKKAEDLEAADA